MAICQCCKMLLEQLYSDAVVLASTTTAVHFWTNWRSLCLGRNLQWSAMFGPQPSVKCNVSRAGRLLPSLEAFNSKRLINILFYFIISIANDFLMQCNTQTSELAKAIISRVSGGGLRPRLSFQQRLQRLRHQTFILNCYSILNYMSLDSPFH